MFALITCNVYPGSQVNATTSLTIYLSPALIPLAGIIGSGHVVRPTATNKEKQKATMTFVTGWFLHANTVSGCNQILQHIGFSTGRTAQGEEPVTSCSLVLDDHTVLSNFFESAVAKSLPRWCGYDLKIKFNLPFISESSFIKLVKSQSTFGDNTMVGR